MLSRRADYGVRAMVDIAMRTPTTRNVVAEIAKRQAIPASFLAKIMPRLARAGLVRTSLGAAGGITLALPAEEISLLQIIEAVDGPLALNLCSLNPANCEYHATCSVCETWRQAQAQLNQTLAQTRLSELAVHRQ
jgi:Rrf2 family protein